MLKNNFTNLFTQWFDKPKVSVFNLSKPVRTDIQIGKWYPTYWTICGFGDSEKGHSNHKLRLAPMIAPNFADLRVNEHAIVVPLRVIIQDYEARFNYSKNRDGATLPVLTLTELNRIYRAMAKKGISLNGSLFDFLGFPVFADFYKAVKTALTTTTSFNFVSGSSLSTWDNLTVSQSNNYFLLGSGWITYRGTKFLLDPEGTEQMEGTIVGFELKNFITYMLDKYRPSDQTYSVTAIYWNQYLQGTDPAMFDPMTALFKFLGLDTTIVAVYDEYFSYATQTILGAYLTNRIELDLLDDNITYSVLPLKAYHRCVSDWNIVSNITDPDLYLQDHVYDLEGNLLELSDRINHEGEDGYDPLSDDELKLFNDLITPKDRLWDLDYFTSQLPTSAQGDDIIIPANSSVIDLAKLTAIQKLAMKLSFSSRYRDVIWNIFNIRPSDARLQQSSVIQSNSFFVQIGETIQTSETSVSSVLGAFGGRGFSAGSKKGYHIFCEEPCVVLNFFSMVAKPSYMDALHPLIHVDDIFDFPIPDMDVLGNQPQYTDLLTGNPEDNEVFGFSRQYMEWLGQFGTVHNNMKTSLDYWTLGRRFDTTPALNEEFLTINPKDDFDRIFSVPDSSHAFVEIYYDVKVTRPVRRSVRILV